MSHELRLENKIYDEDETRKLSSSRPFCSPNFLTLILIINKFKKKKKKKKLEEEEVCPFEKRKPRAGASIKESWSGVHRRAFGAIQVIRTTVPRGN